MKVLLFEDKSIKNYILTAFSIFLFSFSAFGASFVVNSNSDDSDTNPADNLCLDANGNCTLRAAVQQSNALASNDVITFAAGLPTITFTTNTEIIVSNAGTLQINCPGANVLIINGGTSFDRIFKANAATVTFADLTLTDGGTNATFGGSDPIQDGGAILATGGSLTIQRVNITANYAGWGGGQSGIFGGGIVLNGGTHSIQNSTFANNRATKGGGDKPLVGDFDGDGKLDAAVFRASNANWYILRSSNNQVLQTNFGIASDIPTPADFDGDGAANIAVFRPSSGTWFTSTNPQINYGAIQFGANGDMPVAADYDGDGKADTAVFRPSNGSWYLNRSAQGFSGVQFGSANDKPAPNAFIR